VAQIKLLTPQKLADFFHQTVVDPQGMAILSQISGSQNGKADYAQPKAAKSGKTSAHCSNPYP
jgi:protease-3